MKKLKGRLLTLCLSVIILITGMPLNSFAVEKEEQYSYTIFAGKDVSFSGNVLNVNGNIHANRAIIYQCINGVVNGNSSSAVVSYGTNSSVTARNELTGQVAEAMIYIGAKLMETYFTVESKVETMSRMDSNMNLSGNTYSMTNVSVGGNININQAAVGAVNDIEIGTIKTGQGYNVNANQAVLYSVKGDIIIDVDNFNFSGLIYAPNGDVEIVSRGNLGIQGIVIAQNVSLWGSNINVQSDANWAQFVAEAMKEDETSKIPEEDSAEDESTKTPVEDDSEDSGEDFSEGNNEESSDDNEEDTTEIPSEEIDYTDTDGDSLFDVIEKEIGTNPEVMDTDGDDLSDFDEIYLTATNPLKKDTDDNGVIDSEEDLDKDGLNAITEIKVGTFPYYEDSDYDGLLDGEEGKYTTDPVKCDTDEDGLMDGEEIGIGLDPSNPATFGAPDAQYILLQTLDVTSDILSKVNVDENAYSVSVEAKVSGNLSVNLTVDETDYATVIANDFIVGMPIELTYDEQYQVEEVNLSFDIKEAYIDNEFNYFSDENDSSMYSPELVGIKRLQVFKYFEDDNMLLPIETFHNVETNTVKAIVDEFGVYCLIDMEKWIYDLAEQGGLYDAQPTVMSLDLGDEGEYYDFTEEETVFGLEEVFEEITEEISENISVNDVIESNISEQEAMAVSNEVEALSDNEVEILSNELPEEGILVRSPMVRSNKTIDTPVDVVVLLQIAGTDDWDFSMSKRDIIETSKLLFDQYPNSRISVVTYEVNKAKFLGGDNVYWYTDSNELSEDLATIVYKKTSKYCNRGAAFELLMESVAFRPNASKFVYQMCNGYTNVYEDYFSQLDACAELNIIYSEIYPAGWRYESEVYGQMVEDAIFKTGGIYVELGSAYCDAIWEHIQSSVPLETIEFKALVATGWQTITLDAPLDSENGVDTDKDTLLDWDEVDVDNKLLVWNADGSFELPTIHECMMAKKLSYVERGLYRIIGAEGIPGDAAGEMVASMIYTYRIMPINSDPTNKDSDRDELEDCRDTSPLCYDYIPSEFHKYIQLGYIEPTDLRRANDGFTICLKSLGEIMDEMGIVPAGYNVVGQNVSLYYFSDWYIYGFIDSDGSEVYSLIKFRTSNNNLNKVAGVSIPFREFNVSLLYESYDSDKLGKELKKVTQMGMNALCNESVRGYFARLDNETNYFLAEVYLEVIIANDNVDGTGIFSVPVGVVERVRDRLSQSPHIYNINNQTICVEDINDLSLDEQQCLLASRAGTISYNAFAAEIIAHALGAYIPATNIELYLIHRSAKKADLSSSEESSVSKGESVYAYDDSYFVEDQGVRFGKY